MKRLIMLSLLQSAITMAYELDAGTRQSDKVVHVRQLSFCEPPAPKCMEHYHPVCKKVNRRLMQWVCVVNMVKRRRRRPKDTQLPQLIQKQVWMTKDNKTRPSAQVPNQPPKINQQYFMPQSHEELPTLFIRDNSNAKIKPFEGKSGPVTPQPTQHLEQKGNANPQPPQVGANSSRIDTSTSASIK